jgi:exodeoxyribonuclease VII large subunit
MPQPVQSIRLSQLTSHISQAIKDAFSNKTFWVVADITNHSYKSKDNWHFFVLAEKQEGSNAIVAKLEAVAWKEGSSRILEFERMTGQKFTNDIHVLVKVIVDYNSLHGLKLTLVDIDPNFTIGALEQQKQAILHRLLTECHEYVQKIGDAYITRNNRLKLNFVIQRVALIGSSSSAGYEDFIHTLQKNTYQYQFSIDNYFTSIQGQANSPMVKQKLIDIYNSNISYDAVVIIRGGGSQTDFLIFDTFELGQAVAKFPIPVITGIGHQRNETIVDMLAHSPTNAPTKAAEYIIAHNRNFEEAVLHAQSTILIKSQQLIASHSHQLAALNAAIVNKTRNVIDGYKDAINQANQVAINTTKSILFKQKSDLLEMANQLLLKPRSIVSNKRNDFKNLVLNMKIYSRNYFQNQRGYVSHFTSVFNLMSPENILKKGFAIVYHKGKVISNADNIAVSDDITILLSETEITASVNSKRKSDGKEFKL